MPKSEKRSCKFREVWKVDYSWLAKSHLESFSRCTICNKNFSVSHGGLSDVKQHEKSNLHKTNSKSVTSSQILNKFFIKPNTVESQKIALAELIEVYHNVKHNLSYKSLDCSLKLMPKLYPDSGIAKKIACGRTKAESITTNVLGPKAESIVLSDLINDKVYFSVATDTSNKGNRKMYPICVQYFSFTDGRQTKLLDFFEEPSETAEAICKSITSTLSKHRLSMSSVSAFSADNTNANFGKHKSAYTLLHNENNKLIKSGCLAHIVNNAFKHGLQKLDFDVETVVLKIYSHFSSSASRREDLKSFFDFAQVDWEELIKHVPTRWLSLGPAIDKILKFYPALISYFISIGDECPKVLQKLLSINADTDKDQENYLHTKTFIYLSFSANVIQIFQQTSKRLQNMDTSATELYEIMDSLKTNLTERLEQQFFGAHFISCCQHLKANKYEKFKKVFGLFFVNVNTYLSKWFNFSDDNIFKVIECLKLNNEISYNDLMKVVKTLQLENISLDGLFNEYCTIKPILNIVCSEEQNVYSKWTKIFSSGTKENFKNIFLLVSYVLSIPPSNAYVERVFSIMNQKWSKQRNRCNVGLIKSELQISLNFEENCSDFIEKIKLDEDLLQAVISNQKYSFKTKKNK